MIDQVKEKCDLFAKNCETIHKKFFFETKLMSVVSGLTFASADKEADVEKMVECKKILEKNTGLFSNFRSIPELLLVSKMVLSDNPEQYIKNITEVYKKICKGEFSENTYSVLAAILICDFERQDDIAEIVEKSNEIMKRMNSDHPILTSSEDTSFAILLALSYKDADTVLNDIKESYEYLKKTCKVKASSNGIQGLSEVLAITYGDIKEKCDKVIRIFNRFNERKADYGTETEFAVLGSLIDIDMDPDSLVNEIMETEKYLKEKSGFGASRIDEKNRLMYAAFIVADACGNNSEIMSNSVINNTISAIIAKRISIMISIITNALSGIASAKSSSEEKEENKTKP